MGNKDGLIDGLINFGKNKKIIIQDEPCYGFSLAFGNEIALFIDKGWYILNIPDLTLWKDCNVMCQKLNYDIKAIADWWYNIRTAYEISNWSNDFEELKQINT